MNRPDDWKALKTLVEVSWELIFAQLPKKKQGAILATPKRTATKKSVKQKPARRR